MPPGIPGELAGAATGAVALRAWQAVIAAEPALAVDLLPDQLDRALAAIAADEISTYQHPVVYAA